jgi:hypothetical protein
MLIAENKAQDIRLLVEDAGKELGFYLYVMRISTGEIYEDHLQDNLEILFRKAEKDYNIESSQFIQVNEK